MRVAEQLRIHRNEILALAKMHGAENVRVFGSVARGEETAASDLDFLITLGAKQTPLFPGGLKEDGDDLLPCKVDIVSESALHWLVRDQILLEAKPL